MAKEKLHKLDDKVELSDGRKGRVLGVSSAGGGLLLEVGEKGKAGYETSWFGVDQLKAKPARKSAASKPAGDPPAGDNPAGTSNDGGNA